MNRSLMFSLAVSMTLTPPAISLRAANKPRPGKSEKATALWTNQDLERLRPLGLISVVGQAGAAEDATTAAPDGNAQDPEWYAGQAARLRARLENNQAELERYRQAIEDARDLKAVTGGFHLDEGDIGITLEAGIQVLEQRVSETQTELDALEDLARRNDIPPGTLRGQ